MKSFRFNAWEFAGALGDLGTLLPIAIALITLNGMDTTGVFLVVGLTYMFSGLFYGLPMPVQPLKAVAAIAIAGGLSAGVVSSAGLLMGVILLLLSVTKSINWLARLFTKPITRGIQLGVALLLIKAGLSLANNEQVIMGGEKSVFNVGNLSIPVGWLLIIAFGIAFVLFLRAKKLPASLSVLALGIGAGIFWGSLPGLHNIRMGLVVPTVALPSLHDLSVAMVLLVVPQIPLTLGNAVFATVDTARSYFGPRARKVGPRALLTTMGIANLGAGLLSGAPVCHGSSGLTAHFRLGARTGAAGIIMGSVFVALAILFDGNVLPMLSLIPYSVLGVLVLNIINQRNIV